MDAKALVTELAGKHGFIWLVYSRDPGNKLPRSWKGLVNYKRLDIIPRIALSALYPGGVLLQDSALLVFLDSGEKGEQGKIVALYEECMPREALYEREVAPLFLRSLRGEECILVDNASLVYVARLLRKNGYRLIALSEKGDRIRPSVLSGRLVLVLGSYFDPPARILSEVEESYSIGPCSYLASHVAAYINALRLGVVRA